MQMREHDTFRKMLCVMIAGVMIFSVGYTQRLAAKAGARSQKVADAEWTEAATDLRRQILGASAAGVTGTSVETTGKKAVKRLKRVSGVKIVRYSSTSVRLLWRGTKDANYYRVYSAEKKGGTYHVVGCTKDRQIRVDKLKKDKTYYFYVRACKKKNASASDSKPSEKCGVKMRAYRRKVVFAGDSITQGLAEGDILQRMHISGNKKVIAGIGLNTMTFQNKKLFAGKTSLEKVISYKPYRVYIMLGINEIHYRTSDMVIADYKKIIRKIQKSTPDTDIVVCAVSPVSAAEQAKHSGFRRLPGFNRKLKKMAEKMGLNYFDYTAFMKDSEGHLKSCYASADGYHWQFSAYRKYAEAVGEYDRQLDR